LVRWFSHQRIGEQFRSKWKEHDMTSRNSFPHVDAVVRRGFKQNNDYFWALGDALIADCGPPSKPGDQDGSYARLAACAKWLAVHPCGGDDREYALGSLGQIRIIAYHFKGRDRHPDLAFYVHRVASTPAVLDKLIALAKQRRTRLTVEFAQRHVKEVRADVQREQGLAEARQEREVAEKEWKAASQKARKTKNPAAKEKVELAKERVREAKEREVRARSRPQVEVKAERPDIEARALKMLNRWNAQLNVCRRYLEENYADLTDEFIDEFTAAMLKHIANVRALIDFLNALAKKKKRQHLSVVK
jgi:hypothetical protein